MPLAASVLVATSQGNGDACVDRFGRIAYSMGYELPAMGAGGFARTLPDTQSCGTLCHVPDQLSFRNGMIIQ
ncbi:MAG: hypothetical protein GY851_25325 [bacterium]|nr:hypothetical protein [bacterium]